MGSEIEHADNSSSVIVHPHSFINQSIITPNKHFIFDMDETLGSFGDLYILWKGLIHLKKDGLLEFDESQSTFNSIMDVYPEFLRHGILTILEFLYYKKVAGKCGSVYVYTNNQCTPPWVNFITNYLEHSRKLTGLFEPPICAFKINNCAIDPRRTTHEKTYEEFIRCSLLPRNAELCFLDNAFFPRMNAEQVFYIQPKSYHHSLSADEITARFHNLGIIDPSRIKMVEWFYQSRRQKTMEEHEVDIAVSKKLMYLIKEFFSITSKKPNTRKNRSQKRVNVTRRVKKY